MFQVLLSGSSLTNVTCLAARKMEFPYLDSTNYAVSVQKQRDEFTSGFPEFRRGKIKVELDANHFDLAVADSPDDRKMEVIELQA